MRVRAKRTFYVLDRYVKTGEEGTLVGTIAENLAQREMYKVEWDRFPNYQALCFASEIELIEEPEEDDLLAPFAGYQISFEVPQQEDKK